MPLRGSSTLRALSRTTGLRAAVLALCVALLGAASSLFVFPPKSNSVLWLPGGLLLAVLVRAHSRRWPAYLAANFLGHLALEVLRGTPPGVNLVWAVGNTLSPWLGAALMRRWRGDSTLSFTQARDVPVLLVAGGLLSPLPSTTLGAAAIAWHAGVPFGSQWLYWYLGDVLGALLVTPLLLTWVPEERPIAQPQRPLEMAVTCGLLAVVAHFIFGPGIPGLLPLSFTYACFPFLLWAAFRLGPRGATTSSLVLAALAIWHTTAGAGPFTAASVSIRVQMLSLQAFLVVVELSALTLAALVCERHRAEQAQRLLARVGTVLAESLDYHVTLPRIAGLLVPRVASGFALWLEREDGHWEPVVQAGLRAGQAEHLQEQLRQQPVPLVSRRDTESSVAVLVRLLHRERVLGGLALVAPGRCLPGTHEVAFVEDLAHRCSLAMENARLFQEANEAVHVRDEFLSIAAHELRTPLTSLKLHLQSLTRLVARLEQATEFLARLHLVARQVTRLYELVERLLDVGRINTGRLRLEWEAVDLSELVQREAKRLADDLSRAGCTLSVRLHSRITGWWDRSRVEQALSILLSNAMKFGSGQPIELEIDEVDGRAVITVRDHGIGMTPEALERIFGRFERAVSSLEYGGLGLGLFIAREIAEAHGGSLQATSSPGRGATFTLELPASQLPELLHETPLPAPH